LGLGEDVFERDAAGLGEGARSSYSGVAPCAVIFMRTSPQGVSTLRKRRAATRRSAVVMRRPIVVVSLSTMVARRSVSSGLARTVRRVPGRFFFIWSGWRVTSRAPAARRRSMA
jgi:hypothetical protein